MSIQAVLFDKQYNTPSSAQWWLKQHNMRPIKPFHVTDHYIRSRIRPPIEPMRTLTLDKKRHIKAVILVPPEERRMTGSGASGVFGRLTWRSTSNGRASGATRPFDGRSGGSIHLPMGRYARQLMRRNGGAIGSDLGIGAATVGAILAAIAAKKIYDKIRS